MDINKYVSREGYYVCFCQNEIFNLEKDPESTIYSLIQHDKLNKEEVLEQPICREYMLQINGTAFYFMQGYSIILVITSTALKYAFLYFSDKYAGLTSRSKQTRFIVLPIFLLSFIMYAIVPVFATWDMRGTLVPLSFENIFTTGVYSDFNSTWF